MKRILLLLSLLFPFTVMGQNLTVKGRITDAATGEPVSFCGIQIKGTTRGGSADADGYYSIQAPSNGTLVFISIGYRNAEEKVGGKSLHDIRMQADAEVLEGVVVTGMSSVDKRLFTGASDKVSAADSKLDGVADISRSLEGRSAGVSVQNVSGTFGTAPKIRVRGATSIYGSSKPLWVVDGVIMEDVTEVSADQLSSGDANTLISSAIAGLNSDDIESFQILKDGSATSIYGARAMAGVIVVTTKKGRAGQAHLGYTGEYTMRLVPSYANFNIMNSQDQMAFYQELVQKGYLRYAPTATASTVGIYGKMYQLIRSYDPVTGKFGLENTEAARNAYLRAAEKRNTDWFDLLFSNAIQHNHSVSISGGTEKSQHYASLSVMQDPGWARQSGVSRYTANINTSYHISPTLTLNLISNASYRRQKAPGTLNRELDPVSGKVRRDFDINPYSYALNTSRTLDPEEYYTRNYAPFNIFHELDNNYLDLNVMDFRIQGRLDWKVLKNVELSALAAAKYSGTSQEHYIKDGSNMSQAYRAMDPATVREANKFLYSDPDNPYELPVSVLPSGGIFDRTDNRMNGWDLRATAHYSDEINHTHLMDFYGGTEINSIDRFSTWLRGWGLQYDEGEIYNYDFRVFKKGAELNTDYASMVHTFNRAVAFFGTASYAYKSRYSVNGTLRYEGSNRLGKSRKARWLPTWNVSGAWNISEENFWRPLDSWFPTARFRLSYSLTAEPPSVSNSLVVIGSAVPWKPTSDLKETALYLAASANSALTYEKKHEFNVGLDLGFLGNRLNLTLDAYKRNNYDLIGPAVTTGTDGAITKMANVASMTSDGVEVSLSATLIQKKDFSWTSNLIYSHTHNEVTELETYERAYQYVTGTGFTQKGYPVRALFSIPFVRLDREGLPVFINQDGKETSTDINFQELSKLDFLRYEGSMDPTDMGSLGNVLKYKGLTLNVFITYSFGNVIRLDPVFSNTYDDLVATPKEFENRWTLPGDEAYTTIPTIASRWQNYTNTDLNIAYNAYNYSSERVAKGDFIRMKELSLSYDFPKTVTDWLKVGSLSAKIMGTNLFLLYCDKKLNGQDPEFFNTGGVAMPMAKQFTFTLKIGL